MALRPRSVFCVSMSTRKDENDAGEANILELELLNKWIGLMRGCLDRYRLELGGC